MDQNFAIVLWMAFPVVAIIGANMVLWHARRFLAQPRKSVVLDLKFAPSEIRKPTAVKEPTNTALAS